jgi:hypothetical protein
MYRVKIATQPAFTATAAEQIGQGVRFLRDANVRKYDIGAVGAVFITPEVPAAAPTTAAPALPQEIRVVLNWFEELKRLVPTR